MGKKLEIFILYVKLFIDLAIDFFYSLYWDKRKKAIPDLDQKHAILTESATTLARKIKNKELKSEDLVRAVIERIKEVNPVINAIASERYEAALTEAKEVDALIANGLSDEEAQKKPYLGTKECTPLGGQAYKTKRSDELRIRQCEQKANIGAADDRVFLSQVQDTLRDRCAKEIFKQNSEKS